jgi:hypothetical protein
VTGDPQLHQKASGHHKPEIVPASHFKRRKRINPRAEGESTNANLPYRSSAGIRTEAKKTMMEKITTAIDEAYHIGDTLIFLHEYPAENVAMDGRLQSENPKILEVLKKIGG